MTFDDILRELRRCRVLLFLTTCLGVAAAIAYWFLAPDEYESYARVLVLPKDPAIASATREDERYDHEDVSDDLLATHLELMRSSTIVNAALNTEELKAVQSIEPNLVKDQSPTDYLLSRLWTYQGGEEQGKDARIINIGFRHFDDKDSQVVVGAVLKSYQAFLASQFEDVNSEATSLISQAEGELEKELEALESQHLALRKEGPIQVQRGDRISNIHEDTFAELEAKISDLRIRLGDANGRLKAIRAAKASGATPESAIGELALIGGEDASRLSVFTEMMRSSTSQPAFMIQQPWRAEAAKAEYEDLATLRAEERTLLEDLGSKHPDVVKVRNEITAIEEAIEKRNAQLSSYESMKDIKAGDLLAAYTTALEQDVAVMNDRIQELQTLAGAEEQKAKQLVNYDLNDKIMSSRIERKQQLYDAVVSRLNDVSLRSSYGSLVNEVIDAPQLGKRVWPRLSICGPVGAAGGFLLGICIMFANYFLSSRFRTIGDLSRGMPVPVLANIPRLDGSRPKWRLSKPEDGNPKSRWSRLLDMQFANRSSAATAIRGLRNSVLLNRKRDDATLLLVTSACAGEGKSIIAANLALSIAQTGRSVLLVDAQISEPELHTLFACELIPGIAEVLDGRTEPGEAMQTLDTYLRLIAAGETETSAADIFESSRFSAFCAMVRERFEYVIFDGPPMIGTSESQVLASICDETVLVARVSKTKSAEILAASREIERHGGRLVGVVANSWDASRRFGRDSAEVAVVNFEQSPNFHSNGHVRRGESPSEVQANVP